MVNQRIQARARSYLVLEVATKNQSTKFNHLRSVQPGTGPEVPNKGTGPSTIWKS